MKKTKLMSLVLALVMLLGVAMPVFAAEVNPKPEETTNTVYVHKMLMTKEQLDAHVNKDGYDGNQITDLGTFFGTGATEIPGVSS